MNGHTITYRRITAIARKYAASLGHETGRKVDASVLVAALAKALGTEVAGPILAEAGVHEAVRFVNMVPIADIEEAHVLPALVPDEHLASLLTGDLRPFREGKMGALEALRLLLIPGTLPQEVLKALNGDGTPVVQIESHMLFDTRKLTRSLANVYQSRYALGSKFHSGSKNDIKADFVSGEHDDAFSKVYHELLRKESDTWMNHFGSRAFSCSPLGKIQRDLGELEAHIMGAVLLAEMGYIGGGTLRVRELAYIRDPKYYHRILGNVRHGVKALHSNSLVEVLPDFNGEVQLGCQVIPSEDMLDSWLSFLNRNSAILDDEVEDLMQSVI